MMSSEKCDGAVVEMKESNIIFDFTDVEKMFGHMMAEELAK